MMHDRFDARLRQHLLESADERPTPGQVAAIVDAVAVTPQRLPVAARLTWIPGRVGPFPATALRYALIAAALVGATIAWAIVGGGAGPFRSTVFEGTWVTIDPGDGSTMSLTVGEGNAPTVAFVDELASGGACALDDVKRFTAAGTGSIAGPRLDVTYPDGGGCGLTPVEMGGAYLYQAATDTLLDLDGVRWTRAPEVVGEATLPPPPSPAFEGSWTALDPLDGSAMFLTVVAGPNPAVRYVDSLATGGACIDDAVKVYTADGTGAITGSRMVVTYPYGGGCGLGTADQADIYDYLAATDTLVDEDEVTWTRSGVDVAPPTRAPVTEPTPAPERTPDPSPTADASCLQFDAQGTYVAPAGSLSLTASLPGTPAEPWIGDRDRFSVLRAACSDMAGPGSIAAGIVTVVDPNACTGATVPIDSGSEGTREAVDAVLSASGIDVLESNDVALGGHDGTRIDFRVRYDANACRDEQIPIVNGVNPFDPGVSVRLYLIDVQGTTLAVALYGYADWDPGVRPQVDAILASLQVDATS